MTAHYPSITAAPANDLAEIPCVVITIGADGKSAIATNHGRRALMLVGQDDRGVETLRALLPPGVAVQLPEV